MLFEGLPADTVMGDGHKKGLAWGTLLRDGAQERHAEGGNGKYQGLTKGVETIQASLGKLRPELRQRKNRNGLTHLADGFSCQDVPGTQHLLVHRVGLACAKSLSI